MEYKNSNGYFADPDTGEPLDANTPRTVVCELKDGKFIWPQVTLSNGEQVKIVYKCFTDEEKQLYKQYRHRDGSAPAPKKEKPVVQPVVDETVETGEVAMSEDTRLIIANCDKLIGTNQIAGIPYALLIRNNKPSVIYHVPRCLINDEDMYRLCNGEEAIVYE